MDTTYINTIVDTLSPIVPVVEKNMMSISTTIISLVILGIVFLIVRLFFSKYKDKLDLQMLYCVISSIVKEYKNLSSVEERRFIITKYIEFNKDDVRLRHILDTYFKNDEEFIEFCLEITVINQIKPLLNKVFKRQK